MKKSFSIILAITIISMVSLSFTANAHAYTATKKLGRGLVNILTGWVELPKNIYKATTEDNLFAGLTIGLAKGIGMTVVRTGAGVYDTATFPFPLPENFKPLLEP